MDLKRIEDFLINYCGYSSIEEAKKNYKPMNLYPLIGDIEIDKEEQYGQVS